MNTPVHSETRDGIAVLTLANPPVNSISAALRTALAAALQAADADPAVRAIVLTGAGGVFCGGAEVREFNTPAQRQSPTLPELNLVQDGLRKPLVAAIEAFALGGGLEVALACHWRLAKAGARLGLPEVKLGLMPGSGGTQRLPRLVPLADALGMMTTGEPVDAARAAELGLVDQLVEGDLLAAAIAFARRAGVRRVRDLPVRAGDEAAQVLAQARARLARAPGAAVDVVAACEAALKLPFDAGLAFERERFLARLAAPEFPARRHAFFAEREARRIPDLPAGTRPRPLAATAVIGAGTMGTGIAIALANAGLPVTLIDTQAAVLDRAMTAITAHYETELKKGRLTAQAAAHRSALVRPGATVTEAASADLVIEAAFESMEVKQEIFRALDAIARPGAVLATNTSTLDVNRIAAVTARPGDVVGLHFFSPAHLMRLLEIVRADATAPDVLATALELGRRLGKVAVLSGVCDGFIGNRMLQKYLQQALFLLDEGATPAQVDGAIEAWGMAMGPFAVGDLAGLDIGWSVRKRRRAEGSTMRYSAIADRICEQGRLGQKTGKGWYRYEPGSRKRLADPEVDRLLQEHRAAIGTTTRLIADEEIVQRLLFALANEGAALLAEGIALRASDIDAVWIHGYGFPAWRGGPMFHADRVGPSLVVEAIEGFRRGYAGDQWQLSPLLRERAADHRPLIA
ncbi:MAG TPA: 3-hydroxyacyl-CoA dehydrogenase NAD-binding domain-containing protein [Ramlibacter sp.]|nr:3-hydroxyacyl-CoA dehydrogenase NAD-binding domain-containing protein [Ramlibacter sp.]